MDPASIERSNSFYRVIAEVERRGPESPPWSASLGGLLLGGAMLYHVSVNGESFENATSTLAGIIGSVTLSPVQQAVLLLAGIGVLAFAGWVRVTDRKIHVLVGIASGALVSLGYLLLLHEFTPANGAYPLVHSYRATILASVLFVLALVSSVSAGTWRDPRGIRPILLGSDPRRTIQWGVAGSILLVVAAGGVVLELLPYWAHTAFEAYEVRGERPVLATVVILGWFGLAALPGYRREGLVSSWVLVAGPVCGARLALSATDQSVIFQFEWLDSIVSAVWVFTAGVIGVVLIVGTFGYLLGVVIR